MKKLFLLALGGLMSLSVSAQTTKGTKYLGATIGDLSFVSRKNYSNISVSVMPTVGVFVSDNFLLGSGVLLGYSRSKNDIYPTVVYRLTTSTTTYGLTPFGRYYFAGTTPHRFFGQLNAGLAGIRYHSDNGYSQNKSSDHQFTYGAAVGYNYFLTPGAALEAVATYTRYNSNSSSVGEFGIRAGFAVFLPSRQAAASPQ